MNDAAPAPDALATLRAHRERRDAPRPIARDVFVFADEDDFFMYALGPSEEDLVAAAADVANGAEDDD